MIKNKFTTLIALILVVFCTILLFIKNKRLKEQNAIMQNNVCVLLDTITYYKTTNNLNVAKVQELVLKKKQYEKHRAEDANTIKQLKADKLEKIVKSTTETNTKIVTYFDTIYVDSTKHFSYNDKWTKVNGLIYKDSVKLNIKNKEELLVVESLQKKKFWFIKLPIKLFGYKHKQINIISKNPNTQITSAEFITIKQ